MRSRSKKFALKFGMQSVAKAAATTYAMKYHDIADMLDHLASNPQPDETDLDILCYLVDEMDVIKQGLGEKYKNLLL